MTLLLPVSLLSCPSVVDLPACAAFDLLPDSALIPQLKTELWIITIALKEPINIWFIWRFETHQQFKPAAAYLTCPVRQPRSISPDRAVTISPAEHRPPILIVFIVGIVRLCPRRPFTR